MTLYYSLVFALLVLEMAVFCVLILPLPFTWRRQMFKFISDSPVVAKLQYAMKITFIFILVLFIDSVNRVFRAEMDYAATHDSTAMRESYRTDMQARKFYAQRNLYLCGFTLFLSLILNRTHSLIHELLELEDQLSTLRSSSNSKVKSDAVSSEAGSDSSALKELQAKLDARDRDYNDLSEKYQKLTSSAEKKKLI